MLRAFRPEDCGLLLKHGVILHGILLHLLLSREKRFIYLLRFARMEEKHLIRKLPCCAQWRLLIVRR